MKDDKDLGAELAAAPTIPRSMSDLRQAVFDAAFYSGKPEDPFPQILEAYVDARVNRVLKRAWESGHGSGYNLGKGHTKTSEGCFDRFMEQVNARVVLAGNQRAASGIVSTAASPAQK